MKIPVSIIVAPIILLTSACSTHYAVSNHHGHHRSHNNHVSVGVHGNHHGGNVVGALVVGGIIGHLLTEDANSRSNETTRIQSVDDNEPLVNGYPISGKVIASGAKAEKNSEQNRFYQFGEDGNCYLVEKDNGKINIISLVPKYSCG